MYCDVGWLQGESDIWRHHVCGWYHWCQSWSLLCQSAAEGDKESRSARLWHRPHSQRSVPVPGHCHVQSQCHSYLGMIKLSVQHFHLLLI